MPTSPSRELSGLVWEILQASNRLTEAGNVLSAPFGLTSARWQVMGVISAEACSVAEIARRLSQSRQGIQRLADELVRGGLAEFAPNPRHARAKLLVPSARGAEAYRGLMKVQASWVESLSSGMRPEDLTTTRKVIQTLNNSLEKRCA